MWSLLILSALSGLVLADHHEGDRGGVFGREGIDPRLAANSLRLINLEKKVASLKDKLHEAEKYDPERFINELSARLDEVEGTHCDDHQFQCGGNEQECVSDLFVCDGHKDCHNGHDEQEDVCDTSPVKAGNIFGGTSHWDDCLVREDHVTRITITGSTRPKFFKSRIRVRGHVESHLEHDGKKEVSGWDAKGYYSFATRRLVLLPLHDEDSDHLPVVCEFNLGDAERASCHRVLETTLHECAELHVHLQGHEQH